MMRLSDVVGRVTSPTMMISAALILFFLVFLAVCLYAFVLLGRGSVQRFAAMPLEDGPMLELAHVPAQPLTPHLDGAQDAQGEESA